MRFVCKEWFGGYRKAQLIEFGKIYRNIKAHQYNDHVYKSNNTDYLLESKTFQPPKKFSGKELGAYFRYRKQLTDIKDVNLLLQKFDDYENWLSNFRNNIKNKKVVNKRRHCEIISELDNRSEKNLPTLRCWHW